jgi:hypothetical protein
VGGPSTSAETVAAGTRDTFAAVVDITGLPVPTGSAAPGTSSCRGGAGKDYGEREGALRPGLGCECLASRTGVREPRAPFGVARRESPANTCCANDWQQARTTVPNESESPPTEKLYRREFRRGRVNPRTLLWHALWAPLLAAHAAGAAAYGNANGFCLCVLTTGAQLGQDTSRGAAS